MRVVVLVGLEQRDDARGGRVHERAGDGLALDPARQPGQVGVDELGVLVRDRAAADRPQIAGAPALVGESLHVARIGVEVRRRRPRHVAQLEPAEPVADVGGVADLAHLAV